MEANSTRANAHKRAKACTKPHVTSRRGDWKTRKTFLLDMQPDTDWCRHTHVHIIQMIDKSKTSTLKNIVTSFTCTFVILRSVQPLQLCSTPFTLRHFLINFHFLLYLSFVYKNIFSICQSLGFHCCFSKLYLSR